MNDVLRRAFDAAGGLVVVFVLSVVVVAVDVLTHPERYDLASLATDLLGVALFTFLSILVVATIVEHRRRS